MVAWTRWPHGAQKGALPFSRRACQPFLMGKAPQRPALSRDTPKSGAPTLKRLCPAGANSVDFAHWQHILAPAGQGCVIQPAAGGRLLRLSLPPSAPTTAPTEPHRSTPAPCSWGGCASTPRQRRWPAALPPPAQHAALCQQRDRLGETISLRIPSGKPASISPVTPSPKTRRRRQAPARGLAAVNTPHRPNRTEPQHTRPLLVGRVCVNPAPKALAAGTAGWPAALPPFVIFSSRHLPFSARFAMVYL